MDKSSKERKGEQPVASSIFLMAYEMCFVCSFLKRAFVEEGNHDLGKRLGWKLYFIIPFVRSRSLH